MGMYCSLHRATATEIERLIAHPDEVQEFLFPDDGTVPPVREVRPKGMPASGQVAHRPATPLSEAVW